MPETMTISTSVRIGTDSTSTVYSSTGTGLTKRTVELTAAKAGTLTTRTDDNTGTLTMTSGHGIASSSRLDIYWEGGSRYGVTVGTVATNSVPFDLGAGDNLPIATTAITAMVPTEEVLAAVGNDVVGIELFSNVFGTIVLADNSNVAHLVQQIGGATQDTERVYGWVEDSGVTNPLAGDTVAKVFFSHGSSSATATMRAQLLID